MQYEIKRNGETLITIKPKGGQEKEIMVKDIVPITIETFEAVHFQHGDYIDVWGERYTLNSWANITKENSRKFEYALVFQANYYRLAKWTLNFYDANNALEEPEFEVMITLEGLLDLFVANANRMSSGWSKGQCEQTDARMVAFNGENILQAMDQAAKEFGTEWWVVNQKISFYKKGVVTGTTFEYGYDKGLRGGLTRNNIDSSSVFSRLKVYGSDKNLPVDYRGQKKRLQLPEGTPFIQGPKYGSDEIEHSIAFNEIKPERISTVTWVGDMYSFSDSSLDFNINGQVLPGIPAKIDFITGHLSGYQFDIASYNHTTKTIRINKNEQDKGNVLPTELLKPAVGDTYSIIDIQMPQSYVTAAEQKVLEKGQEYFNENSAPKVTYTVPPDHFFFERNQQTINLGDYYGIRDADLAVDRNIRAVGFTRDLHKEFKYTSLKLSDVATGSPITRQYAQAEKLNKVLAINKLTDLQRARQNWRTTNELSTMLETLRAEMLLIVSDGGEYSTDVVAMTTLDTFSTSAGTVNHEKYDELGGVWAVPASNHLLPEDIPYYVYFKVNRIDNLGTVFLSSSKIAVESDPAFYFFPFGIISSKYNGTRLFSSTKGYTRITGGNIDTDSLVAKIVKTAPNGARIEMYGNTIDSYNPNGNIARRQTVEMGIVKDKWYNTSGDFIYEWGQNGVRYAENVPASWSVVKLRSLLTNPNANFAALSDAVGNSVSCFINQNGNQYVGIEANKTAYLFTAGQNPSSEANRPYEGHKNTSGSIQGDNIPDGWYMYADTVLQSGVSGGAGINTPKIVDARFGYGAGVTGGAGGPTVTVTTREQLAIEAGKSGPRIIKVSGLLTGTGMVDIANDKTIVGLPGSKIDGFALMLYGKSNIILRNLTIGKVQTYTNVMMKEDSHHIWIDHCDLYSDRDHGWSYYDSLIDIGHRSTNILITFCLIHDNNVAVLIGFDDSHTYDEPFLKTTLAFNYFYNCSERQPNVRFTKNVHSICNLHEENQYPLGGGYAVGSTMGAVVRMENNHYKNISHPVKTDHNSAPGQVSGLSTNKFENCGDNILSGLPEGNWTAEYEYVEDYLIANKDNVEAFVKANSGPILTEAQLLDFTMPAPSGATVASSGSAPGEPGYILEFMYMTGGKVTNGMTGVKSLEPTHACTFEY